MRADPARRSSRIAAFLMLVVGIQIPTAPVGAGSSEEVSKARSEREALQRRLDAAVEQYERAQSRLASTKEAAAVAQTRLREAEGRLQGIRAVLSKRARITYRRGRVGIVSVLLDSKRIGDFARRLVLLQRAAGLDSAALVQAGRARAEIAERKGDLESRRQDQHRIVGHLRALTSELTGRFRQAQAL
ncbi:MAG: coiled-coil domain-containing protein, partial [Candidatus Methylomirabilales bacterium]